MESVMTQVCMQFKRPWGLWGPQRVNNPTDLPLGGAVAVNEWHSAALELVQGGGRPPVPDKLCRIAQNWSSRSEGAPAPRSVIGGERPSPKTISQETSRVSGGSDISSGGWKEREKICVNLTKRLRTASILRDCAHVTGCVFWDGCFIRCLLQCCISCS